MTTMAKKRQQKTQKDNHGDGQEKHNQECKKTTMAMARRNTPRNVRG
jgi:hypothetical protein